MPPQDVGGHVHRRPRVGSMELVGGSFSDPMLGASMIGGGSFNPPSRYVFISLDSMTEYFTIFNANIKL